LLVDVEQHISQDRWCTRSWWLGGTVWSGSQPGTLSLSRTLLSWKKWAWHTRSDRCAYNKHPLKDKFSSPCLLQRWVAISLCHRRWRVLISNQPAPKMHPHKETLHHPVYHSVGPKTNWRSQPSYGTSETVSHRCLPADGIFVHPARMLSFCAFFLAEVGLGQQCFFGVHAKCSRGCTGTLCLWCFVDPEVIHMATEAKPRT